MIISDPIYGKEIIDEEVLIETINNPALQRLKGISQWGLPNKYWMYNGFDRYTHTLGVLIMLRKLGATPEEQIAGLLHDVSHSSFSHIADWVFKEKDARTGNEDYQDEQLMRFVKNFTNIPEILERHGFNYVKLSQTEDYSILERHSTALCADRVDYSIREIYLRKNKDLSKTLWRDIINLNGELVFQRKEPAEKFAYLFLEFQNDHWGSQEGVRRYYEFAKLLQSLIKKGLINENDLYTQDEDKILKTIEKDRVHRKILLAFTKVPLGLPVRGIKVQKKFRYVDPKIYQGGKVVKLSQIDNKFNQKVQEERILNEKGVLV